MRLDRPGLPSRRRTRSQALVHLARRFAFAPLVLCLGTCIQAEAVPCQDADGDGYGANNDPACLFAGTDCDDGNPWVNPGAQEICGNGKDDDCTDGDQLCPEPRCEDADADRYGEGPLCLGTDCNDSEPAVNPGAEEICGDGIDNDCFAGDEECLPRCGDGWLSLGVVRGTSMGLEGDYASPDPDQGEPWILLSPGIAPGDTGTAWIGWSYDAALADCVTELSVFVYAFDDSLVGTGANIAFDNGDGTAGERIANIDADENWYGNSIPPDDHVWCDVHTCVFWIVITAGALDYTHIREAEAAIYLDRI